MEVLELVQINGKKGPCGHPAATRVLRPVIGRLPLISWTLCQKVCSVPAAWPKTVAEAKEALAKRGARMWKPPMGVIVLDRE